MVLGRVRECNNQKSRWASGTLGGSWLALASLRRDPIRRIRGSQSPT